MVKYVNLTMKFRHTSESQFLHFFGRKHVKMCEKIYGHIE